MSSYQDLLVQREKLEKQIEEAKAKELVRIIEDIKQKMADYGLTLTDLGFGRGKPAKTNRPRLGVAPKYRDPASGSTWSGRGKPPKWIAEKDRNQYLIQQ
ncbi:H-NS histone family protein [Candidatus Vallotiella sp. (ex Adelges kitamiensis)]|uniref:H-NS histone family protein n=1 Tax=Candidatus Vallotiella sp. (ex Adelges kitamiensis) TaxID=2864217 RepID=UPI001CE257BD|nr:H-NS histone family protein [Candidatus Vallotia sp. (ex Adelges kitamiensis)]